MSRCSMVRRPVSYFLSFLYLYSYCALLPAVLSFRLHHLITLLISSLSIRQRDRSHLQSPLVSTCLFSVCAALQVRSLICFLVFEFNIWLWISLFSVCAALQRFNTSVKSANLFCTADQVISQVRWSVQSAVRDKFPRQFKERESSTCCGVELWEDGIWVPSKGKTWRRRGFVVEAF